MKYRALQLKLWKKGYDVRSKELGSCCYPTGKIYRHVGNDKVSSKRDWPIAVFCVKTGKSVLFNNMRQVQRWADNNFKDENLPSIEYNDGYVCNQTLLKLATS